MRVRRPLLFGAVAAVLAGLLGPIGLIGFSGSAAAASGTWGQGNWPYSNGVICQLTNSTVPLVSWPLGAAAPTAFLLGGISETNGTDSGRPPTVPSNSTADPVLAPNTTGSLSAAQIGAAAYLISTWGSSSDPSRVAETSEIIAEQAGPPTGSDCLTAGQGGTSTTTAQTMWSQAQQYAGPYTVALTSPASAVTIGSPVSLQATVTSALGYPVPGLTVSFSTTNSPTSPTVRTDANGHAVTNVSVGAAPTDGSNPTFTATVSAPIGLRVHATTGAVAAVYASSPATAAATLSLPLAAPVNPTIHVLASAKLAVIGSTITTTVSVSGLNGHPAIASITVAGPLAADANGDCRSLNAAAWTTAQAADTGHALTLTSQTVPLIGDGSIAGPTFTVASSGCYSTTAQLQTAGAVSAPTARLPYATPDGSVDAVAISLAAATAPGGVTGTGPLPVHVTIQTGLNFTAKLTGDVRGPVSPTSGSCTTVDWTKASTVAALSTTTAKTAGVTAIGAPALATPGCYAIDLTATLTVAELGSITVPVVAGTDGSVTLVVAPLLAVNTSTTWIDANHDSHATIEVLGTLTQPATIESRLLWQPSQPRGCQNADWTAATEIGTASTMSTDGDGSYSLTSAVGPEVGCYSVVSTLTLAANSGVVVTAGAGSPGSVLFAENLPVADPLGTPVRLTAETTRTWLWSIGFAVVLVVATFVTAVVGRRTRIG